MEDGKRTRAAGPQVQSKVTPAGTVWWFRTEVPSADGKRRRVYRQFDRKTEAAAELRKLQAGQTPAPAREVTVRKVAEAWTVWQGEQSRAMARYNADQLRCLLDRHGDLPVQKLTADMLAALRDDMRSGKLRKVGKGTAHGSETPPAPLSSRTVNGALSVWEAVLEHAVTKGWLVRNPCSPAMVKRVKKDPPAPRVLWQPEQVAKFVAYMQKDRLAAAWWLALLGLRRGEVLGLTWGPEGVDLEAGRLTVSVSRTAVAGEVGDGDPKTGTSRRSFKLPTPVLASLRAMRDRQETERMEAEEKGGTYVESGYVITDQLGRPMRPELLGDRWHEICHAAGMPRIKHHDARDIATAMLDSLLLPRPVTQAILGHANRNVTDGYSYGFTAQVDTAVAELVGALQGTPPARTRISS